MSDDPDKRASRDRSSVVGEKDNDVQHFAEANRISVEEARVLIKQFGNDRRMLELDPKKPKD